MINLINLEIEKDNVWIIIKPKTNKGIGKAKEAYKNYRKIAGVCIFWVLDTKKYV